MVKIVLKTLIIVILLWSILKPWGVVQPIYSASAETSLASVDYSFTPNDVKPISNRTRTVIIWQNLDWTSGDDVEVRVDVELVETEGPLSVGVVAMKGHSYLGGYGNFEEYVYSQSIIPELLQGSKITLYYLWNTVLDSNAFTSWTQSSNETIHVKYENIGIFLETNTTIWGEHASIRISATSGGSSGMVNASSPTYIDLNQAIFPKTAQTQKIDLTPLVRNIILSIIVTVILVIGERRRQKNA